MLDDTFPRRRALIAHIRNRDRKGRLIRLLAQRDRVQSELVPTYQWLAHRHTITRNNRHVCNTIVWSADVELNIHGIAHAVRLDVVLVVVVLEAFAGPDVAGCGVVVGLAVCDLKLALDVAVAVGGLVVVHLLAACGGHGGSSGAGSWRGD